MAAPAAATGPPPVLCPSFAVVCSFLERYGTALDLPEMTFPEMERYLQETSSVPKPLVELHVKLLRKMGKSVSPDRWEKYLGKLCQEVNGTWAWELETKGYPELTTECKTDILKYLCESQFDENLKFKMAVNEEEPDHMRLQPIGRDREGLLYWLQLDQEQNVRVYVEEQDDVDGSSWRCIVRSRNDLAETLELLKSQIPGPDVQTHQKQKDDATSAGMEEGKRKDTQICTADETRNPKKADKSEDAPERDSMEITSGTNHSVIVTKAENEDASSEKDNKEGLKDLTLSAQTEDGEMSKRTNVDSSLVKSEDRPVIDNRVSTIKTLIKVEPKDTPAAWNAVSVVMAPGFVKQEAMGVSKTRDVVKKRTPDEVERALKSDQQAKIPLKKRELKRSESFDTTNHNNDLHHIRSNRNSNGGMTTGGIIVRNPSVLPVKEQPQTEVDITERENRVDYPVTLSGSSNEREMRTSSANGDIRLINDVKQNVVKEPYVGVGVIMGPGERKQESTLSKDRNGLHTNFKILKTENLSETENVNIRQSVLVRKNTIIESNMATRSSVSEDPTPRQASGEGKKDLPHIRGGNGEEVGEKSGYPPNLAQSKGESLTEAAERTPLMRCSSPREIPTPPFERVEEEKVKGEKAETIKGKNKLLCSGVRADQQSSGHGEDAKEERDTLFGNTRRKGCDMAKTGALGQDMGHTSRDNTEEQSVERCGHLEFGQSDSSKDEVSSELQKEGIRLKIKIPLHRRTPEIQREREEEINEGQSLRRSARICRPSPKLAEIQDRKQERKQTTPPAALEEEDHGDNTDGRMCQKRESHKKMNRDGQIKLTKGRRRHRRVRWSNIRSKNRKTKLEGEEEVGESREKGAEQDSRRSEGDNEKTGSESEPSQETPNDDPCRQCGLPNHPELILLCDQCDGGYHTACLRPPLMIIPDGEWFCPPCQHKLLCDRLEEQLQNLDMALKKRERAERRRERLVYVGISVENIISTPDGDTEGAKAEKKKDSNRNRNQERRSTRTRKSISYRFDDFDEAIDEAIEEDIKDSRGGGAGRGKDMATITCQQRREEGKENRRPAKTAPASRRKKRRRLNDLDSDSTMEEEESEDEFQLSSSSEEEEFVVSGEEGGSEGDAGSYDYSDWGSTVSGAEQPLYRRHTHNSRNQTTRRSARRLLARQKPSSEEEMDESEEEEEQIETEGSSEFSESDRDRRRRRSRRSQNAQVNYRETSESEGNVSGQDRPQRHCRRLSSSNSEESMFSKDSEREEEVEEKRRWGREKEGAREDSKYRHRQLILKRRRTSTDEDDDDDDEVDEEDSEESEEEERPVRKRLNRIETDEEEKEDNDEEEKRNLKKRGRRSSGVSDCSDLSSGLLSPGLEASVHKYSNKNTGGSRDHVRHSSLASQRAPSQDQDEEDFSEVTDLVHFVFNSDQLS